MAKKELKTNVMRVLDSKKLAYNHYAYDNSTVNGVEVARLLGQDPDRVFKTLVTRGKSGGFFVFMVPVAEELDLKKAARACGEKAVEMLPQKELLPRGGRREGHRHDQGPRASAAHRLCARRLLAHWYEKAVPHLYPSNGGGL